MKRVSHMAFLWITLHRRRRRSRIPASITRAERAIQRERAIQPFGSRAADLQEQLVKRLPLGERASWHLAFQQMRRRRRLLARSARAERAIQHCSSHQWEPHTYCELSAE